MNAEGVATRDCALRAIRMRVNTQRKNYIRPQRVNITRRMQRIFGEQSERINISRILVRI